MAAVTAILRLDNSQYLAEMKRSSAATQAMATNAVTATDKVAAATKKYGANAAQYVSKNKDHINTVANGVGLFGAAVAAGVGVAAKKFADFDQAMSKVAASGDDAKQNMAALREAAIQAGASTAFSATEAAAGIENLAKAGVSAKDTLGGGLKGALDLAAAGSIDVGFAAETAATAMTQFNLQGKDVPHIADLLAAAAGKAQGEVSDFASALNQSGLVASQFGLSIEDTTGTLAAFASAGLLGSDAGTSFKTMLLKLANPSKEAADTMKSLGINAYDAQGSFVGIAPLAEQLKTSMGGLSQAQRDAALSTIFGSDAIRAANVLYSQGGAGIKSWTDQVNDAGFAAETAKTKMDNLKGDLEGLSGAFETALIGLGEGANGPLRDLVQSATDAVNAFNDLSSGTKSTVLTIGATLAGAALGAAALGKLAVFANEAKTAMVALGISSKAAVIGIPGIGIALAAVGAAVSHFAGESARAKQATADFQSAMSDLTGYIDANTAALNTNVQTVAAKALQDRGSFEDARQLGLTLKTVTDAALGNATAMDEVRTAIKGALSDGNKDQVKAALDLGRSLNLVGEAADTAREKQNELSSATGGSADALFRAGERASQGNGSAASSLKGVGAAAAQTAEDIKAATDAMYAQANAALALSGNAIAVEAAMDAARDAAKKNGETLDINTAKGRANQQALDSLASATLTATQAMVEQNKPASQIVATNERARKSYIDTAVAMGKPRDEATKLANSLFQIPKEIRSQVVVAGGKVSKKEATELNKALKDIPPEQRARIVTIAETKGAKAAKQAMAEIKDKQVIARSKGDLKGAKQVSAAMKALKDRLVLAKSRGDTSGAKKLQTAINNLKGRTVPVKVQPEGIGATQSAISAIKGRTVRIKVVKDAANGSYIDPVRRAGGGPIRGYGGPREDNIAGIDRMTGVQTAWVSASEFVVNAAATAANRAQIEAINAGGKWDVVPRLAGGGIPGAARASGVDQAFILRLIAALGNPLSAISAAAKELRAARSVKAREDREVAAARRAVKAGGATKSEKSNLSKQLQQQKDAAERLKAATLALADANNAAADSARSMSDQFSDAFRSASTDAKDWVDTMLGGSASITAFTKQIGQLRQAGLSESLIQQLIGQEQQNSGAGAEAAASILAGGKSLVDQLNAANKSLERAADALGYLGTTSPQRKAAGGPITGPGTGTSDSIPILASNGEYMVNAVAAAAHRPLLDSINYGRNVVSHRYAAPGHYRYGGPITSGISSVALAGALRGMRIEGEMEMVNGRAYIRGVAVEVYGDENRKAQVAY